MKYKLLRNSLHIILDKIATFGEKFMIN